MGDYVVYGPVPSRRLGRSLGINNLRARTCSYSCLYCQIGRTLEMRMNRYVIYEPAYLARSVKDRVERLRREGETVDYLSFVPEGEPTLDINLGREIDLLRDSGIKIAVFTNSSLISKSEVRSDLSRADWVCLKVDTISPSVWHNLNRPHNSLNLNEILEGILAFSNDFKGELTTDTMLVNGINDSPGEVEATASFIAKVKPRKAYISIPTRPPAENIKPPFARSLQSARRIFSDKLECVESLTGYEGDDFVSTGNAVEDLLSITAVHPMRRDAVDRLLKNLHCSPGVLQELVEDGLLIENYYGGNNYYTRNLKRDARKKERADGV